MKAEMTGIRQTIVDKVVGRGAYSGRGLFDTMVNLEKQHYGQKSFFRKYPQIDSAAKIIALGSGADRVYNQKDRPPSEVMGDFNSNTENEIDEMDEYELPLTGKKKITTRDRDLDVFRDASSVQLISTPSVRSDATARMASSPTSQPASLSSQPASPRPSPSSPVSSRSQPASSPRPAAASPLRLSGSNRRHDPHTPTPHPR